MKYSLKNLESSSVAVTLTLEKEEFDRYRKEAAQDISQYVQVKGFRKGKAPLEKVVEEVGEARLFEKTIDKALQGTMQDVIVKEKLHVIGQPHVDVKKLEPFEAIITLDIMPKLQAIDLKKFKIKQEKVEVTKKDVDQAFETIQENNAEWKTVQRKAKKGDRVEIDFEGSVDGELFEGGASKHHPLVIGSNTFIPGFEDQLIGVKENDETKVNVTFPKDYHKEDLKNKKAVFQIKVHQVSEKILPDMTDDFVKTFTEGRFNTKGDLETEIKQVIQEQKEQERDQNIEQQIIDQIIKYNTIQFPKTLINEELSYLTQSLQKDLESRNMNLERYLKLRNMTEEVLEKDLQEQAQKRVSIRFNLRAIADAHNIEVSQDEITSFIAGQTIPKDSTQQEVENYVRYEIALKKAYQMIKDQTS